MKIIHIVGARPNFIKLEPVYSSLSENSHLSQKIVHTGQHYDPKMSSVFFEELSIPKPDINLEIGSGSHAIQTAAMMEKMDTLFDKENPNLIVVYGDVNSTVAAALTASKKGLKICHVESGLRSRDRSMPEEINRIITDHLSDYCLTPSSDADENLIREGIDKSKIVLTGNVMIDTLVRLKPKATKPDVFCDLTQPFSLVTLHRPSNVDDASSFKILLLYLGELSKKIQIIFPIHPRTKKHIDSHFPSFSTIYKNIALLPPLSYLNFLWLQAHALFVLTDSGGIQEETTFLNTPCFTLRENTERPITCTHGTNKIIGSNFGLLNQEIEEILEGKKLHTTQIPLWDGQAGVRIAKFISQL